ETAGHLLRRVGRAIEVPKIFNPPGVEPRLDMAEPAVFDCQLRLHAGHVAEDFRPRHPAESLCDIETHPHVVVASDADGARPPDQSDYLAGPADGAEGVTGIA